MDPKTGGEGSTAALMGVGHWIILTIVGIQLISDIMEILMAEQVSSVLALTHLTIAMACFVMLWRPWAGLSIGSLSMTLVPLGDETGADSIFFLLASAIFVS